MSHFQKNLDALRTWTPTTAELLAAAQIPSDFHPALGTDATPTFRRLQPGPPRRVDWLGHTSMPRTSAEPLVHSLAPGAGNGLGLSMGSGHEWRAFSQKLSNAQALFIYEPDPAFLRMPLEICDLSDLLASGKIILLSGPADAASSDLSRFLATHIGFEPPTVLQPLPTIPAEWRNPLLSSGESIVRRAVLERHLLTNTLAARVESIMFNLADTFLLLALTPRYAAERLLIPSNPKPAETLFIDHHAAASIAVRLRAIADHRPKKILSDLFRHQLACVPHTIAVETWIPPLVGPAFWQHLPPPSTLSPDDRIIVHSADHSNRLIAHGIPASQIQPRPLPRRPIAQPQTPTSPRRRVALIADLVPIDPKTLGIDLPTHLAVFHAAAEFITNDFLTIHPGAAPDILRRALARANVAATSDGAADPALRDPMLQIIRDLLIPTLPLLALARQLLAHQIPLHLVGDWQGLNPSPTDPILLEPFPRTPQENLHWTDTALLVHLSPTGTVSPILLDAIAAQIPLLAPQHPTDQNFGALPTLLKPNTQFAHPNPAQFLPTLKPLLRDPTRQKSLAAAAL